MKRLRVNLFLVALGLSLLGLVMVYSATSADHGQKYLLVRSAHMVMGVGAFVAVSRVRYTLWRKLAPALYFVALLGLILVFVPDVGTEAGGARRWLDLGAISFQPAELAKIAAVVTVGCAVSRRQAQDSLPVLPLLAIGLLFALVLMEPDFGTAAILLAGVGGALWASEVRMGQLLAVGGLLSTGMVGVMLAAPYRRERFMSFLSPGEERGVGYQVARSVEAIKSGDLLGTGVGGGMQGDLVPELRTDMIFALVGEELGVLGMGVIIGSFLFIALAGFFIAMHAPSVLGRSMAGGLVVMLCVQAALNIGGVMGVLPLTGMTLPFVSYGGSSLVISFLAVGILYRISEDGERVGEVRSKRNAPHSYRRRRNGRARHPGSVRGG
jgi:cell division protein FtsW